VLDALAERLGEPRPETELLVATRGNTSLALTAVPGRGEEDPRGRWALHLSVSPLQQVQAVTHFRRLEFLRAHHPGFPVPDPMHMGEVQGIFLVCTRRLGGLTAPQHAGDLAVARRMYAESAAHLAKLVVGPPVAMDEALFAELIEAKLDLVARYASVPSTLAWLAEARARAREQLMGERFPRVVYHADLRSKHVQVAADGRVLGYLDFGSSEASDLPYFDLLHLIVHERKQEAGLTVGDAWRAMLRGGLRDFERAALEDYRARLGLSERWCRAIERLYPVLVTAMAEKNWEYSRPRWMHRAFGI
jgi:aminoglycoside phosphotransferase (APT) family kinase protein